MNKLVSVRGDQVGRTGKTRYTRHRCVDCGAERWVQYRRVVVVNPRCRQCAGLRRRKKIAI